MVSTPTPIAADHVVLMASRRRHMPIPNTVTRIPFIQRVDTRRFDPANRRKCGSRKPINPGLNNLKIPGYP